MAVPEERKSDRPFRNLFPACSQSPRPQEAVGSWLFPVFLVIERRPIDEPGHPRRRRLQRQCDRTAGDFAERRRPMIGCRPCDYLSLCRSCVSALWPRMLPKKKAEKKEAILLPSRRI